MGFPKKIEINRALKKLENAEGTLILPKNATPLEKLRWDICQEFIKYKQAQGISQKEMAERLGADEAKVSKILHHRIDEFSTDRLINLFFILNPELRLKVG